MLSAVFAMARSQQKIVAARPLSIVTGVFNPLLWLTLVVVPRLSHLSSAQATQSITGVLVASVWGSSLWSGAGIIRRERNMGTLAVSFTGRLSPLTVLLGKTIGGVIYDTGLIVLTDICFVVVMHVHMHIASPIALTVAIASVIAGGVASSLMIGACLMLTRHAFQLTTAVGAPVLLFAGTIVPYSLLPHWVEWVGYILNISWLQRFLATTAGRPCWTYWLVSAAISAAYVALGAWALRVLLIRARRDATLELG